jgi:hypothetical protein
MSLDRNEAIIDNFNSSREEDSFREANPQEVDSQAEEDSQAGERLAGCFPVEGRQEEPFQEEATTDHHLDRHHLQHRKNPRRLLSRLNLAELGAAFAVTHTFG